MGKVTEKVIVKNFIEIDKFSDGLIAQEAIRTVELEAIVDTGAAFLGLPPEVITKLGLRYSRSRTLMTTNGQVKRKIFLGAVIIIQGRDIQMEVMENDETTPPLIGYLVLESMVLVVEPREEKVTPNPEHNGKWIMDLL
jgi:clan AA aspartic protease